MSKQKPKRENKEQSKRFIEKARETADKDASEAFKSAIRKVIPPKPATKDSGD